MKRWTAYTRLDWALLWRFGTAFDQTRAKTGDFGGQQKRLISSKRTANFWRLSCFPTQDYHVAHMFCTLHEISYSVGIVKLMAFYVFYQQNCDEVGVKLQFFSFGEKLIFDKTGVQTLRCLNVLRFDITTLKTWDMKLIKFQNVSTWWDWALFCWYHLTQVQKWVKFEKSFDHVKTSFCWKRCTNSRQMHCFAFRYRTGSNMIMKRNETLNSIHPVRLSTFVTFCYSVWSNTSKYWRFRGPAKTSDFVKTHCKLLAIELLSDARLSCCTHVLYTTWNFLFGGYCQVDGILRLLSAELRRSWSKTAVFQFWRKVDFWQNWCANIALFEHLAFRYHHFNNMGHEAN